MLEIFVNNKNDKFTGIIKDSIESIVFADEDGKVIYSNKSADMLFENLTNIKESGHLFSFDVCILDKENIFNYNPIQEAYKAGISFRAEVSYEVAPNQFKNLVLRAIKTESNFLFFFSDVTEKLQNQDLINTVGKLKSKVSCLEKDNEEFSKLREVAQSLAIRTGLVNRISGSIRENLEPDRVIYKAIEEISNTLGISKSYFAEFDNETRALEIKYFWSISEKSKSFFEDLIKSDKDSIQKALSRKNSDASMVLVDPEKGVLKPRLIVPVVYQDRIFGSLVFYLINNKRNWHEEEISLIESIALHLASAINQAQLFRTITQQKQELENALEQLKDTQAQLVQSEKMASLGQLVAGVAHEINTPLGSINSNNDIFSKCVNRMKENACEENQDFLEIMEDSLVINNEAIKRINTIVKSLKNFARLDEAEYQEADINEGLKSTLMLINHEIKNRIKLIENYGNIPPVKCYPNQLNQVFMNILVNAYQSIEGNGTISIKTEEVNGDIQITISDSGKGIPKEDIKRIFDPGFTTKGVGVGTGLGLSICYQIIEKHRGNIYVESEAGKGTSFVVKFPV